MYGDEKIINETQADGFGGDYAGLQINIMSLIYANEYIDESGIEKPLDPSKSEYSIECNGKKYCFSPSKVEEIDDFVLAATNNHLRTMVRFIATTEALMNYAKMPQYLTYPGARDAYKTNPNDFSMTGFNTSNIKGMDYFAALMEFLSERYSNGEHGYVQHWTFGNEIDFTGTWYTIDNYWKNNTTPSSDTYIEEFYRLLRVGKIAVGKYNADANVYAPFTHYWDYKPTPAENYDGRFSYKPREIVDGLASRSRLQGNFMWGVEYHPYCSTLPIADVITEDYMHGLKTGYMSGDDTSRIVTYTNLEVLDSYLSRPEIKCNGKGRPLFLMESGVAANSNPIVQQQQAAIIGFAYLKMSLLDNLVANTYYKYIGNDGLMSFALVESNREKHCGYYLLKDFGRLSMPEWNNKYSSYIGSCGFISNEPNYLAVINKVSKEFGTGYNFLDRYKEVYGEDEIYKSLI